MVGKKGGKRKDRSVAQALSKLSVNGYQIPRCRRLARSNAWIFVVEVS